MAWMYASRETFGNDSMRGSCAWDWVSFTHHQPSYLAHLSHNAPGKFATPHSTQYGVQLPTCGGFYAARRSSRSHRSWDRLLLGLKGIMSEAELHFLRVRMHEGRLNKARRGEL